MKWINIKAYNGKIFSMSSVQPTHWMPLPDFPKLKTKEEKACRDS